MLNKEECTYWYNYIFDCFSKEFDEFGIEPHRIENPFSCPMTYKPLRKKELAVKFVHDLVEYYRTEEAKKNNPLQFEEIKPKMWIWNNVDKEWLYVTKVAIGQVSGIKYFHYLGIYRNLRELKDLDMVFEENRFYRKEVD